jgi:NADH-quinone oxidoreductase subunit H
VDLVGIDAIAAFLKAFVVVNAMLGVVALMSWVERRGSGLIQLRLGPNRVGPFGLFQPIADGIKFIWKEDIVPPFAHRPTFVLAPIAALVAALMAFSVIPFGGTMTWEGHPIPLVIADLDYGILFLLAVSSLSVYGIIMAGWASNSKYSQLGGLRSSSQMISYELALALAVVAAVVMGGSLRPIELIEAQAAAPISLLGLVTISGTEGFGWYVFANPLGFVLLTVAIFAETNRLPFDLPEAESELVAGYHTEYSAMKFSMFLMAEYVAMITGASLLVTLYLGGYTMPGLGMLGLEGNLLALAQVAVFALKVGFFMWVFVWVRWTLPRFRFDQLLRLGWKILIPLGLANVLWAAWLTVYGRI